MLNTTIPIQPLLGSTLDSRDEAIRLFHELKDYCITCSDITLDFSDIVFMSRSFADQFHKEKLKWSETSNLSIYIRNEIDQIHDILKIVSRTQKINPRNPNSISVRVFSKSEQLLKYLSTF